MKMRFPWMVLVSACSGVALSGVGPAAERDPSALVEQHRLLNAFESSGDIGAWQLDEAAARPVVDAEAKCGTRVVEMSGVARIAGAKGDASVYDGRLAECHDLSAWVCLKPDSNVGQVGFEVCDATDEKLMWLIPGDWTGWKKVSMDPRTAPLRQAYEQKGKDGKLDLPIKWIHLVWFTASKGPSSLKVDALTAITQEQEGSGGVAVSLIGTDTADAGSSLDQRLIIANEGSGTGAVTVSYTLQENPQFNDSVPPDARLGQDHALGCSSTWSVDGTEMGDAKFCDGDDFSGVSTPYGKGFKEAVATIDLGTNRAVLAIQYVAGDANWLWYGDVSVSTDNVTYTAVPGWQDLNFHKKWAQQSLPVLKAAVPARWIRFRFNDHGTTHNFFRLPLSVMVYDGAENDVLAVPKTGEVVESGSVVAEVPPHDFKEFALKGQKPLPAGSYLLGLELSHAGGKREVRWSPCFARTTEAVDTRLTRRFGINASQVALAPEMRRCGFGWVRFENAKWMMFCTAKDHYAFDGSVAPWGVNHDAIFAAYQALGMQVLPYVFMPPEWATSAPKTVEKNRHGYPPADPADYTEAIYQIVARDGQASVDPATLKTTDKRTGLKTINAVELWNEPNLNAPGWGPFVGPMSQYYDVLRAGAEGARRADPALPVSSCGFAGIKLEIVGGLSEHRYADGKCPLDFVDIINVHFYSGREEPEICGWDPNVDREGKERAGATYPDQIEDLVAWRDQLKPKAEIWLTETGNDVGGPIGRTERYQAAKVPRTVMIALAEGIEKVFIYRERGSTPAQHAGAGLLRDDLTPRPSWLTVATMIRQLKGFTGRALRLVAEDPKIWSYYWEEDGRRLVTAWRYEGVSRFPWELGESDVTDAFGHTTHVKTTQNIELGIFPAYIVPIRQEAGLTAALKEAREKARQHQAERAARAAVVTRLFDFGPVGQEVGMLKGYGIPRRYTAVDKSMVWNEQRGYGFSAPAMEDVDQHWIRDFLERDFCKLGPGTTFRFSLPAGRFKVALSAESVDGKASTVSLKSAAGKEDRSVEADNHVVEFVVEGGGPPLEVVVPPYGKIRWLSAISQ